MINIGNVKEFIQLLYSYQEVIIFSEGDFERQITLEFLRYTDSLKRVCCLSQERVDSLKNIAQKSEHSLPVIPLEHLPHFHESAIVIVVSPPQLHKSLCQKLYSFGFRNIVVLNATALKEIETYTNKFLSSGIALSWFINHTTEKFSHMENFIAEQNELCALNSKAFARYRNCFRGKKIFIFATGPTVKYYLPPPPPCDAICIGLNFAWRIENVAQDYLFMNDVRLQETKDIKMQEGFSKIKEKIFIGRYSKNNPFNWLEHPENYLLDEEKFCRYYLNAPYSNQTLYTDICCHGLAGFGSVAFPALHFALFTYPSEIYLVGCDTSRTGHFYDDSKKVSVNDSMFSVTKMKVGYARIKMFAKQNYPDTEIISVNPVGLKGLFRDIYTDNYKFF